MPTLSGKDKGIICLLSPNTHLIPSVILDGRVVALMMLLCVQFLRKAYVGGEVTSLILTSPGRNYEWIPGGLLLGSPGAMLAMPASA